MSRSSRTMTKSFHSSDQGTLSFEKVDAMEMQRLLANGDNLVTTGEFVPLSDKSSARKRKISRSDTSSLRKRQCVQQIPETSADMVQPPQSSANFPQLQLRFSEEPEPERTDDFDGMQLANIDEEDFIHTQEEPLRLTEGPGLELMNSIEETQIAYQKGLCLWLNKMRKESVATDMRFLTSGDKLINAHSFIVRSIPFFARILQKQRNGDGGGNSFRTVISVEADAETMKTILDFLYTGTCTINAGNVFTLLAHAARVRFDKLVDACAKYVKKRGFITPNNCISIVKLLEKHEDCEPCQALKEYVLGTLCEQNFLECVLLSETQLNELSEDAMEILLYKSVYNIDSDDATRLHGLWKVVYNWIGKYQEKLSLTREHSLRMLNTIAHRKMNSESKGCTFDIVVPKDELHGYSCTVFSMGTNFEVKLSVAEDADGVSWLGLRLDMKEDELKPSWYRACGFQYQVISEDCVFACCEQSSLHFDKDFRKGVAGARRVISMEELLNPNNSYVNSDGSIHIQIRVEPDHITGFAMHYIIHNFQKVWEEQRDAILSFGIELLTFILKQDALNVEEEGLVLKIICLWLTDECLDVDLFDEQDIIELLSCVRWNFTNPADMERAFEIIHSPRNGHAMNVFKQCTKKMSPPNDNPRDSYQDRSPTFQAWHSLFRDVVSSSQLQHMLEYMSNMLGNSPENMNVSKSQLEAQISQEVGAHCASHCANFLHTVLHQHEVKCL